MFARKARQFFFFMLLGGLLFMFSAFSVPKQIKDNAAIQYLSDRADQLLLELKYSTPEVPESVKRETERVLRNTKKAVNWQDRVTIDEETGAYLFKGKKYVYIQGQYYPYNPTHRYKVDGQTVFHRVGLTEKQLKEKRKRDYVKRLKGEDKEASSVIEEYQPQFGLKSTSPDNLQKMIKSVKRTRDRMQERAKALDQVMNATE